MKNRLILCIVLFWSNIAFAFTPIELMQSLQKTKFVQGEFYQSRFLNTLPVPIKTYGSFTLMENKGLLWEMKQPFNSILCITSKGIAQWNNNQWIENTNKVQNQQVGLFLGILSGDIKKLQENFNLNLHGTSSNWQLDLVPNTLLMKQIFNNIRLKGDNVIREITLDEKQGDKTIIEFHHIKINGSVNLFIRKAFN